MFDRNARKMLCIPMKSLFQLLIFISLSVGVTQSMASSNDNAFDTHSLTDDLEYTESHRQGRCKLNIQPFFCSILSAFRSLKKN